MINIDNFSTTFLRFEDDRKLEKILFLPLDAAWRQTCEIPAY